MYLDQLPSVRITELRRAGTLTPNMTHIVVTLQGNDGAQGSTEVSVVRFRMLPVTRLRMRGRIRSSASICMPVRLCAGAARAFAIGARTSLRFAALIIELSGSR
jgi:hypothetical protein